MTRKEIARRLNNTPLMVSAMTNTVEELQEIREQIAVQSRQKRAFAWRSYRDLLLVTIIGCTVANLLVTTTLQLFVVSHIMGQIACVLYWYITAGNEYRKSVLLKKHMYAVIDTALYLKQHPEGVKL